MALDTVTGRQAMEAVPFHHARGAAPLAGADYIDRGHAVEVFHGRQDLANLGLRRRLEPEFTDVALRLTVGLGKQDHARSSAGSAAIRFQLRRYMTPLRAGRFAARLVE